MQLVLQFFRNCFSYNKVIELSVGLQWIYLTFLLVLSALHMRCPYHFINWNVRTKPPNTSPTPFTVERGNVVCGLRHSTNIRSTCFSVFRLFRRKKRLRKNINVYDSFLQDGLNNWSCFKRLIITVSAFTYQNIRLNPTSSFL